MEDFKQQKGQTLSNFSRKDNLSIKFDNFIMQEKDSLFFSLDIPSKKEKEKRISSN